MDILFILIMMLLMVSGACAVGFVVYFVGQRARYVDVQQRLLRRTGFTQDVQPHTEEESHSGLFRLGMALATQKPEELKALRTRLAMAGLRQQHHLALFILFKTFAAGLAWAVGAVLWLFEYISLLVFILPPFVLYYGPDWILRLLRQRRLMGISQGLPEFIDMCNVCISAGMGWLAALRRVAKEMEHVHPCISREFSFMVEQIKAGLPRAEALQQLADRNPTREMRHLVQVLIQNERQGSPVADSLSAFTARIYQEREQYMEEKAGKVAAKMSIIIAPFMLLPFIIILVGEQIVNLIRSLG